MLLFWVINQLDNPALNEFSEFDEPDTIQLLDNSILSSKNEDENSPTSQFDMETLDKSIFEIESFISDLDKKL